MWLQLHITSASDTRALHVSELGLTNSMTDLNLAVLIFLVVLITQIVNWVGKTVLQDAVGFTRRPYCSAGLCGVVCIWSAG